MFKHHFFLSIVLGVYSALNVCGFDLSAHAQGTHKQQILYVGTWTSATPYTEPRANRLPAKLSQALTQASFEHEMIDVSEPYFQTVLHINKHIFKGLGMSEFGGYGIGNPNWTSPHFNNAFKTLVSQKKLHPDWVFIQTGPRDLGLGKFDAVVMNRILDNITWAKPKRVNVVMLGVTPPTHMQQTTFNIFEQTLSKSKAAEASADFKKSLQSLEDYWKNLKSKYTYSQESNVPLEKRQIFFVPNILQDLSVDAEDFQTASSQVTDLILSDDGFSENDLPGIVSLIGKKKIEDAKQIIMQTKSVLSPKAREHVAQSIVENLSQQKFFEAAELLQEVNQDK